MSSRFRLVTVGPKSSLEPRTKHFLVLGFGGVGFRV